MRLAGLAGETFFDKGLEEVGLEADAFEAEEGEDRVALRAVGLGEEHLDDGQVLHSFVGFEAAELKVDGFVLGFRRGNLELHVDVHH